MPRKHRGSRQKGVTFEKRAIRELKRTFPGKVEYHRWVRYIDQSGEHYCEPEAFILREDEVVLFEMKLTGGQIGKMQMEGLYAPLLSHIFSRPVRCLQVCKWVNPGTPGPFAESFIEFVTGRRRYATLQWLP